MNIDNRELRMIQTLRQKVEWGDPTLDLSFERMEEMDIDMLQLAAGALCMAHGEIARRNGHRSYEVC